MVVICYSAFLVDLECKLAVVLLCECLVVFMRILK